MESLDVNTIVQSLFDRVDNSITSWDQLPHYSTFKDMSESIQLFKEHIEKGSKILCVHDSDVDGMSTYIEGYIFFGKTNYNIELCITDRSRGYGFQPYHIDERLEDLPKLIITADNGITSHKACIRAKELGIDVIITDHHLVDVHEGKPPATRIIDPHQSDCNFKYPDINGAFVYWYFLCGLNEALNLNINMKEEFLPELCLSTIADVMPLIHINRFIVKEGLKIIPYHPRQWLRTWYLQFNKNNVTAEDMAFNIIPALNATNRLTDTAESVAFLVEQNEELSKKWLFYIQELNTVRKEMSYESQQQVEKLYGDWLKADFILVPSNDIKKGLLGPMAGKFAEKYKKPAIVLTKSKDGSTYSGSGRSTGTIDLLGLVKDSPYVDQLKTGGHKAACGVSFKVEDLNDLWTELQLKTRELDRKLYFDQDDEFLGYLDLGKIDYNLFLEIEKFQPFGHKFKKPMFACTGKFTSLRKIGKNKDHYSGEFKSLTGTKMRIIKFFIDEEYNKKDLYNIVFTIAKDDFNKEDPKGLCLHLKKIITSEELLIKGK